MSKFLSGVLPAWLRNSTGGGRRAGTAARVIDAAVRAAGICTAEALEERRLFAFTTLTNGTGDGALSVTVDQYGAYGSSAFPGGEAFFDPVGAVGSSETTYESGVWFGPLDNFLAQGTLSTGQGQLPDVAFTSTTASVAVSNFTVAGYGIQLTQTVAPKDADGTTLTQVYRVTNNTGITQPLRFVRHVDGDMQFVPNINDFAGVSADNSFVFEFDTATDPTASSGYFGISSQGGNITGYAIHVYDPTNFGGPGYFDDIDNANGIPGGDINRIQEDTGTNSDANGDRLTDYGYDVTITQQTDFPALAPGGTITYTTITRFSQGAPADVVGTPQVVFSTTDFQRSENGGFATIVVNRAGANLGTSTVDYATIAGGTATDGLDYTGVTGTVTFNPGQTRATFTIPILDDNILDGDETVLIQLSNPSNGTQVGTPSTATLTILDDTPFIQLSAPTYTVLENIGVAQISVVRTGSTEGEATVDYQVNSGTAIAGQDFTAVSGTLFFANGQSQAFIQVPITLDFIIEPDESAEIIISNVVGSNLGTPTRGVLVIQNFETPPAVLDVDTIGFNNRITGIVVTFSADLDPARAELYTNYDLFLRKEKPLGGPVSRTRVSLRNAGFRYDAAADTVTISPRKGLKYNKFYELQVNGGRVNGISALGGTLLDGNQDTVPGDDYRTYFGRGNKFSYYDLQGDKVTLENVNGGLMDIDRPISRDLANVDLQDVFPLESIITGTFTPAKKLTNNSSTIVLTNSFGVTRQLPPEIIVETPDLAGL